MIPIFIWITPGHLFLGALVFGLASVTDFLDGYLARKSGQVTSFGIIMDPIADKFLVISALVLLVDMSILSVWPAAIIIVREFLITALRAVALSRDIVIKAEMGGKLKTGAQITGVICLILQDELFGINLDMVGQVFIWLSIVLGVLSAVQYTVGFWKKI